MRTRDFLRRVGVVARRRGALLKDYFCLRRLRTLSVATPSILTMKIMSNRALAFLNGIPATRSRVKTRNRIAEIAAEKMHKNFDIVIPRDSCQINKKPPLLSGTTEPPRADRL